VIVGARGLLRTEAPGRGPGVSTSRAATP
jgi:hypothetical protein